MPLRPRLIPTLLAATAAVGAGVTVGACGSDDFSPDGAIATAADATAAVDGMRFSITEKVGDTTVTGSGFLDARHQRTKMVFQTAAGEAVAVSDRFVIYEQLPGDAAQQLAGGKPWIKLDMAKLTKSQGVDLEALSGLGGSGQQRQQLEQLKATGDVREVGTETIDGAETTHYRGTIDVDRIADAVPARDRAAAESSATALKRELAHGETTIPVEVWVDGDHRVRRLSERYTTTAGDVAMTMGFSDFGSRQAIGFPAASDVQDVTDRLIQAAKQQNG